MKHKFFITGLCLIIVISILFGSQQFISLLNKYRANNPAAAVLAPENITLYNGENATLLTDANRNCLEYATETAPGRNATGKALKMNPDPWHAPAYHVNCGGQDRLNFSTFNYIEFYVKGNQKGGSKDFNIVSYYGRSNTVNIMTYVQGGVLDNTWRLVSIPLSSLKTATYNLGAVDTLYFGTDAESRQFEVDDIVVRKQKTEPVTQASTPSPSVNPPVLSLYDGEPGNAPILNTGGVPCLEYADNQTGIGKVGSGLRMRPDAYHAPAFKVYCGGRGRLNLSNYAAIEFYIRADQALTNEPAFKAVSYFGESNAVPIKKYTSGGVIDTTWRMVSIPVAALKTSQYNLDTVDTFYFGTDTQSRTFYIDNIVATQTAQLPQSPTSDTSPVRPPPVAANPPRVIYSTNPENPTTPTPVVPVVNVPQVPVAPPIVPPVVRPVTVPEIQLPTPQPPLVFAGTQNELYDYDEIDLANRFGQWLYAENKNHISLNFLKPYNTSTVTNTANYTITSSDDPAYATAKRPLSVGYRWRTIYAPAIRLVDLKVAYRVFLKLPSDLKPGKTYTVRATNLGIATSPFTFTYDDNSLNKNVKVNQVGYLPNQKKIGYVGQYMGTAGAMPFNIATFEVKNAETGIVVYTGTPRLRNVDTAHTGETVYDLDFTGVTARGTYVVRVPGVGVSYPFRIGTEVYNEVLSNAIKGAYHQRSSTALTKEFTRFTHDLAHMNDAYVMNHNPIPEWFRGRFDSQGDTTQKDSTGKRLYFPTTLSNQFQQTTKGHYDAGDYGKYVVNGALFVGNLLAGFDAFPERMLKDDLHIPESGNGIPDLIDEVKWEMDWLENMQDPVDGGVFCIVKPDGAIEYYENRMPDGVSPSRRLLYPKDTTCTAAYAAALAKAGRDPLMQQYYSAAARRYIEKAEKAWEWLERNPGYLGWHHYGIKDEFDADRSLDERVWASVELFGATGKSKYKDFMMTKHNPEYIRWGWHTLFEASGMANYACAFMDRGGMDAGMKQRCQTAVIKAADSHVEDISKRAYRLSMSDSPLNYRAFTYFFPQERIMQLLVANVLKPKPQYIEAALYNWDYTLGANPTGYTFITGLGAKRFREPVSTQSVSDGIKAPVSGLPIGMGNNFGYLEVYKGELGKMFPGNETYPLLHQIYDGYNIGVEFMVSEIAQNLVSSSYFATIDNVRNLPPSSISIQATPVSGAAPLTVQFRATATDADGRAVRFFWDFDDESYSVRQNPVHTFADPYKLYKVVLTVTDNDGAEKHQEIGIRTSPATFVYTPDPYQLDGNTIALFHFDTSTADSVSSNRSFSLKGNARITEENVQWMRSPNGKSMTFNTVDDVAVIEIPRKDVFPSSGSTLVAEAKIYVGSYLSENVKSSSVFSLSQGDDKNLGLYDAIYVDGTHIKLMNGYNAQQMLLSRNQLATLMQQGKMKTGTWSNLKFVISGGKTIVYVNNDKIAESAIVPNFAASDQPIRISMGGFKGYVDELRLSSVIR